MEATNLERVRLEWRDSERIVQSEAVSTSAPASTSGDTGQATSNCTADSEALQQSGFMLHKIEKRDTLAGIAIKYNVSVADLKRFNGLLSETAMYGRESLLVPTRLTPVG
mmetsp:Transcript_37176/g.109670  ORF Transcript_37176/g.109670 Transcript_37176/m.109670 type:complete len:110 (-) Transcript_37176:373-702(-)